MHIINLRMREIRKLKELYLEPGVLNTEALMLVLKKKSFPDHVARVFKYLDAQDDSSIMSKKLFTVTSLNTIEEYKDIEELVIPDSIIYVDGNIAGFAMPLIDSHKNLGAIINDNSISLEIKLHYLEQSGNIIDKIQRIEKEDHRFQFGDLNEFNFIIDKDDKLKAIDLDSSYLGLGEPLNMAYYLLKNKYIQSLPEKYKSTPTGIIIPTDNTDLYCYNMIILNALSKVNLYRYDIDVYYKYLEYLKYILDLPTDIIKAFHNIYIPKDNINPKDILKEIDTSLEDELDFEEFKKYYIKHIM